MASPGPALIYLRKILAGQDTSEDPMHELITTRASELDASFREFIKKG